MRRITLPAHVVLMLLVLIAPLAAVDCNETGDLLRGSESRILAASILTEISRGVVEAVICTTVGLSAGLSPEVTETEICRSESTASASDTGSGETTVP